MKIYTKKGDGGYTRVGNGTELCKDDALLEALGTVDELNAALGVAANCKVDQNLIRRIQGNLLAVGADLSLSRKYEKVSADAEFLEGRIDFFQADLPELVNFILPGGSAAGAWLHHCRTVCRRAERIVVTVVETGKSTSGGIVVYLNRLSDLLFVLARHENRAAGVEDVVWKE